MPAVAEKLLNLDPSHQDCKSCLQELQLEVPTGRRLVKLRNEVHQHLRHLQTLKHKEIGTIGLYTSAFCLL